MFEALSAVFEW